MSGLTRVRVQLDASLSSFPDVATSAKGAKRVTNKALVICAVFAALATGCKSDSQKVCDKLASLAEKAGEGDELAKKAAEEFKDTDKCIAEVDKLQKEDPAVFADAKTCILDADKLEDAVGCLFKAALDKKSKS